MHKNNSKNNRGRDIGMARHLFSEIINKFWPSFKFKSAVLLSVMVLLLPTSARAETASAHVQNFQNGLISVMKDAEQLGVQGRYDRLKPLISDTFNLPLMAALSAGPYWKSADTAQRNRLVSTFTHMSVATLATLFDGYSGETFTLNGEKQGPQGITFVITILTSPSRQNGVEISYIARQSEGTWRLIDVIVDGGISELKVRISEYNQTLKTGGISALSTLLEDKAKQLLAP